MTILRYYVSANENNEPKAKMGLASSGYLITNGAVKFSAWIQMRDVVTLRWLVRPKLDELDLSSFISLGIIDSAIR